jgi:hypothetical protein
VAEAAFVHALLDADGRPRYVAQSKDVRARVAEHWKTRRRPPTRNRAFYAWLCSLGLRPECRVIAQVPYADRYKQEHFTEQLHAA